MKKFCLVFSMLLVFGCESERGQNMVTPVMDALEEEPTTPTDPTAGEVMIDVDLSDVEFPPEGTVPEDVEILETDRVFHYTERTWGETMSVNTFDTAAEAAESEAVLAFVEEVKAWIERNCGKPDQEFPLEFSIQFTSRVELEKFKDEMPGRYTNSVGGDEWWHIDIGVVVSIVDSKDVYFQQTIHPNNPCQNFPTLPDEVIDEVIIEDTGGEAADIRNDTVQTDPLAN